MVDTVERVAQCQCRQLRLTVRGDPVRVYGCSCFECQRRTGSVFSYTAQFEETAVTITGEFRTYRRISDKGSAVESNFCPTCGGAVFNRRETRPGLIGVGVGTFNDPDFLPPALIAWGSRRHTWMILPDGVASLDTQ